MQRAVAGFGVRVVFKLLVSLCLALYCGMVVWGDGPARRAVVPAVVASAAPRAESGIRVLPAPERPVRIGPQVAKAAPRDVPAGPHRSANERLAALVMAALNRTTATVAPPANTLRRWIAANTANVRAAPTKRSALSGKIGRGGEVWVLWAEPNGWVRLRAADGTVAGFVHKSLLTDAPPSETRMAAAD